MHYNFKNFLLNILTLTSQKIFFKSPRKLHVMSQKVFVRCDVPSSYFMWTSKIGCVVGECACVVFYVIYVVSLSELGTDCLYIVYLKLL